MLMKRTLLAPMVSLGVALLCTAQPLLADGYCYVVADQPGDDNAYLYDFSAGGPATAPVEYALAGDTNTSSIEASEFNPINKTFYAWNANVFGTIGTVWDGTGSTPDLGNPGTGLFTPISTETSALCGLQGGSYVCGPSVAVGTGNSYDIDGMAYNPVSDLWFGSVRIDDGGGRPDWLVVFDNSGNIVENYFGYNDAPANNEPIGFVEVQAQSGLDDVDDLGFNVVTGELYGVANEGGNSDTVLMGINISDGATTDLGTLKLDNSSVPGACGAIVGDAYLTDVEGVSIDLNGNIFAVTGNNGDNASSPDNDCLDNSIFFLGTVDDLGQGDLTATYLLQMSETDQESISCLVYDPVTVGDTVFDDRNGNGVADSGEGIPGVILDVYNALTGDLVGSKITDVNGFYLYQGLVPDTTGYRVEVAAANFLADGALEGMEMTVDPDTPTMPDNQGLTGGLPSEGDTNTAMDFGYRLQNAIIGEVFEDLDGDRLRDPGEVPIAGVTVRLLDGGGSEVATTTTGVDGAYQFFTLSAGTYTVEELDPAGYLSTSSNSVAIVLTAGDVGTADFGDLPPGAVVLQLQATSFCDNDIPYVDYSVTPLGFSPSSVTIRWSNTTAVPPYSEDLPAQSLVSSTLLWPGAAESGGVATDWPGWELINGDWEPEPTDPRIGPLDFTVIAGAEQVVVSLAYPSAAPDCAANPNGPASQARSGPLGIPLLHPLGQLVLILLLIAVGSRRMRVA